MLNLIFDLDETLIKSKQIYKYQKNKNNTIPFIHNIKGLHFFYINFKILKKIKTKKNKKKCKTKKKVKLKKKWNEMHYLIFQRTDLDIFLRFCFKHFNVGFWTNGLINYGREIIKNILTPEEIKKCFCLIYRTSYNDDYYYYKDDVTKKNFKIKRTNGYGSKKIEYIYNKKITKNNTILFDDGIYNKALNCTNTVLIPNFDLHIENDNCIFKLMKYLDKMKKYKKIKNLKLIEDDLFKDYKLINSLHRIKKDKYEEGDNIFTEKVENDKNNCILITKSNKNNYIVSYINENTNKLEEKKLNHKDIEFKYIVS